MLHLTDRGALRSGNPAGRWVLGVDGGRGLVMGTAWPRHDLPMNREDTHAFNFFLLHWLYFINEAHITNKKEKCSQ
jgi:hypothetical protein